MRAAELNCGVPLADLMERAGAVLAEAVRRFGAGRPALIACGPGNNGGDGYVAARLLRDWGARIDVVASAPPSTDLARAAAAAWGGPVLTFDKATPAPILLDCLFGTGLARLMPEASAQALARLAEGAFVIAADLPSGVASDDGADHGAVEADITVALGSAKPGHLLQPGASRCGTVLIADIGVRPASSAQVLARPRLSMPGPQNSKYTRGFVLVIGGAMPGAAALSAAAALRAGAGYVMLAGQGSHNLPDAVIVRDGSLADLLDDPRIGAVVIGPGLGRDAGAIEKLDAVMRSDKPVVLDADALSLAARDDWRRSAPVIATPHAGEFARAFGAASDKLDAARAAAARTGWTLVFKGADTVIASPGGAALLAPAARPWLASAGTGDVLAGITGAMLARGLPSFEAAAAAVWLHGEAARIAGAGLIADDLCAALPRALGAASQ